MTLPAGRLRKFCIGLAHTFTSKPPTMKRLLFVFTLLISAVFQITFAQTTVNGRVLSKSNEPIPFANILILNQADSSLVQGGISDLEGLFSIPYQHQGSVYASVSYIGYNASDILINNDGQEVELGTIILEEDKIALNEIVVKSRVPLFEQKIDRVVVNVKSSVTNAGNTALNVLNKSPNVNVNRATGQLSLQGRDGVIVMINDKEVRMEAGDLISLLEGMPAANIKEIELITTPPSKFDAQGVAGIINIKMLDDVADGFKGRGTVFGGLGERPKYGASLNFNLKKGKLSVYANASANVDLRDPIVVLNSDFDYLSGLVKSNMNAQRQTRTALYNGDLGIAYRFHPGTELGFRFNFYNRDYTMNSTATTLSASDAFTSNEWTYSDEVNNMLRSLYNVYLNHDFTEYITLNVDYDYVHVYRNNPTHYHTIVTEDSGNEDETYAKSQAQTPLNIHVAKADLEIQIEDNLKLESGLKYTYSGFENDVSVAQLEDERYVAQDQFTRRYTMDENIYAAYASLDWKSTTKLLLKGGVRYENYSILMNSSDEGVVLDYTQGRLFPNLFINYSINEDNELNGTFAQRIQRPGFLQLAPYFYFFNRNTLFTGNPKLSPSYSSQFKLNYRHQRLHIGLEYTYTDDPVFTWQPAKDVNRQLMLIAPSQGFKSQVFVLSIALPWNISNRWESNYNLLAYHRNETAAIMNKSYQVISNNFNFSMNHSFEIIDNWIAELNYMYNSNYMDGATEIARISSLDLGLQHKFKNGAVLVLNVADIFQNSNRWVLNANVPEEGMSYDFKWQAPSPVYRISLSIPLGNRNVKDHQQRSHGSADELNRL